MPLPTKGRDGASLLRCDIDRVRTRRRDGQRSNRTGAVIVIRLVIIGLVVIRLSIKDRIPGASEVVVFQTPPLLGAMLEDIRWPGTPEIATVRPRETAQSCASGVPGTSPVIRLAKSAKGKVRCRARRAESRRDACSQLVSKRGKDKPRGGIGQGSCCRVAGQLPGCRQSLVTAIQVESVDFVGTQIAGEECRAVGSNASPTIGRGR